MRTNPRTPGAGYPQKPDHVAENPTLPKEFICPEWSKFSEIPLTTRPVIKAANAWPSSWTKVTNMPKNRQIPGVSVTTSGIPMTRSS